MRLVLLGAPGSGKGTQGALLAERRGIRRIATGDLLREAVRDGTPLGQQARRYMDAGELVPDDLILDMIRDVLDDHTGGFVFDGFPRTLDQARALDDILRDLDLELDAVLVLDVPDDILVKRLSGRRACPRCNAVYNIHFEPPRVNGICDRCGAELVERDDDDAATVANRLQVFRRQTEPLIHHYQASDTTVTFVDGQRSVDEVQDAIGQALLAS